MENISPLMSAGAVESLLKIMSCQDPRLVDAAVKALRAIVQHPSGSESVVFKTHLKDLVHLLLQITDQSSTSVQSIEVIASIFARVASNVQDQLLIHSSGATEFLLQKLDNMWSGYPRLQEACMDALSSLSYENPQICAALSAHEHIFTAFLRNRRPCLRLTAATCLTHMYRTGTLNDSKVISLYVLPCIIKLFEDETPFMMSTLQEKAISLFAYLVVETESLQAISLEADAITKLAAIVVKESPTHLVCTGLQALAAISTLKEECRKSIIDCKLVPSIVGYLSHQDVGIREAACRCTRSLSRSVKNLRTCLMDAGVAEPLFKNLYDANINVQIMASASLCNIVLDFSPMKKVVLEKGAANRLVELVESTNYALRLNALWALKNILFQTDSDTKCQIIRLIGWQNIKNLLNDNDLMIQEQTLNLLRNAACGKESDIDMIIKGLGESFIFEVLEHKLSSMHKQGQIVQQALYIIVNIATGSTLHKSLIISRPLLLRLIHQYLGHESSLVRVAAVWCVINLSWHDDQGAQERIQILHQYNFTSQLTLLEGDENIDVRERARTALLNLNTLDIVMEDVQ